MIPGGHENGEAFGELTNHLTQEQILALARGYRDAISNENHATWAAHLESAGLSRNHAYILKAHLVRAKMDILAMEALKGFLRGDGYPPFNKPEDLKTYFGLNVLGVLARDLVGGMSLKIEQCHWLPSNFYNLATKCGMLVGEIMFMGNKSSTETAVEAPPINALVKNWRNFPELFTRAEEFWAREVNLGDRRAIARLLIKDLNLSEFYGIGNRIGLNPKTQ